MLIYAFFVDFVLFMVYFFSLFFLGIQFDGCFLGTLFSLGCFRASYFFIFLFLFTDVMQFFLELLLVLLQESIMVLFYIGK